MGSKTAEWFALILLESIPYTLKGGRRLKIDTIQFKDWGQIWRQSRTKTSKFDYFHLFQRNKVKTFIQDRSGKRLYGLLWYFRIYSIYPEMEESVWKSTPKDSRIDVKFDFNVVRTLICLFSSISDKFSYKAVLENGWMVCFDTCRIYSIYPERGEETFENRHHRIRELTTNWTSKS